MKVFGRRRQMDSEARTASVSPSFAIPGGEVLIELEGLDIGTPSGFHCTIGGQTAGVTGASSTRILATVPENSDSGPVEVEIKAGGKEFAGKLVVGKRLAGDLHQVANPAVDPKDGSVILTRSGTRGQELPVTLFRLDAEGFLTEMSAPVMNPTGVAFDPHGRLVVTNRADGEVVQVNNDSEVVPLAGDLGIATGLAFDSKGELFVGDRGGTVFRVGALGNTETWAVLEPSVSAYHMAFGPNGSLYVSAPGLCSHDLVYKVDEEGAVDRFFKGLGRPQGLAFDEDGNLFCAACLKGRHGIVKISYDGESAELFLAGMGLVGLCFTRTGEMIAATNDAVFSVDVGIEGILLD
ncbi:MAG: gluconolaconase [Acidobacteria bacterium]|nr:MAG: gluconolaconase [Acidobacteriota bacterium]REK01794.1 MAG: gluconolaconase [Acidobacteriota bacterium]REK14750.1 MAG: gluconolaconase [Acidobacteriota bacterium]REK45465.1 MAG: gluconolaconase [Acidobacteriota bacterium]